MQSSTMKTAHIAFFGLGTMGIGMARRLLRAGYDVTVYNRNAERAKALGDEGAHVAATAREAAARAGAGGILIAMLADDVASRAIWLGKDGALAGVAGGKAGGGAVCIECSTISVPWVRELAAEVAAGGGSFLDAPVTGTKPHAANGELTFLVGGADETLGRVRPILAAMSKEIVHIGPTGAGAELKLINNFICGVQAAALAEGLALVARAGLNVEKAMPVLVNGAPGSPVVKMLGTRHGAKDYTPNFQLRLMAKDIAYAMADGERHGLWLTTGTAALATFKRAMAAGLGDEDMAAVIKFMQSPAAG